MKDLKYSNIYFIGIGGIGMSALARYFNSKGVEVVGYDKTETRLTQQLAEEGIAIHYEDFGSQVKNLVGAIESTLIVITPAVPQNMEELTYLKEAGFTIQKRAQVLGRITARYKTLAVAGTHGKTTTSTMLAHVLSSTAEKCNAFLGGISANFNSNLLIEEYSPWMVVEADEYDRSFHQLKPFSSIITSTDADHLDIYKSKAGLVQAFEEYGQLIAPEGKLILHASVDICKDLPQVTYGVGEDLNVDYIGLNLRVENGHFMMDVLTPDDLHENIILGLPGIHNAENALSVIALCESIGVGMEEIRPALLSFKGVKRRFELVAKKDGIVYIDDYAHHPTAINSLLDSIRLIYKNTPIYVVFQPHLFSRTQDFMTEFAESLSKADEVILMPIYPAREEPIKGITSEALGELMNTKVSVQQPEEALETLKKIKSGVILTVGAGNIDRLVEPIQNMLS